MQIHGGPRENFGIDSLKAKGNPLEYFKLREDSQVFALQKQKQNTIPGSKWRYDGE